jgi:hypothetical protein
MLLCCPMAKYIVIIGLAVIFYLGFVANPAFAKGQPENPGNGNAKGNPHLSITLDEPDEGDNEHPSGKDRSVEPGGSGAQGNSNSDPDDDGRGPDRSNGGPDKQPDGAGGVDRDDQDNNNGCGNDDDFEDDNEGWCGGKPKDDNGNGNGNGNGGNGGNGNGDNGNGNGDNGEVLPDVKDPGEVLGIQSLPETASPEKSDNYLPLSMALILAGITLHAITKRLELVTPK